MRCAATVTDDQCVERRASGDLDTQCQRQAAIGQLCFQHYQIAHRHLAKLRADHRRIVNRILEIPPRA